MNNVYDQPKRPITRCNVASEVLRERHSDPIVAASLPSPRRLLELKWASSATPTYREVPPSPRRVLVALDDLAAAAHRHLSRDPLHLDLDGVSGWWRVLGWTISSSAGTVTLSVVPWAPDLRGFWDGLQRVRSAVS